jgi:sec-independent protein translocase protein TatB
MFDIGWQEIFILAVIALIVIGPKDLPSAIRTITRGLRKAREMARDLRDGMDDVVREAELEDLTNTISGEGGDLKKKIKDAADLDFDDMDLEGDLRDEMTGAAEDLKAITDPGASRKDAEAETAEAPKKRKPGKRNAGKPGKRRDAALGKADG